MIETAIKPGQIWNNENIYYNLIVKINKPTLNKEESVTILVLYSADKKYPLCRAYNVSKEFILDTKLIVEAPNDSR